MALGAALSIVLLWFPSIQVAAEEARALRGVALIIGQSDYEHLAPLPNPANDADAVEELFDDLGFETTPVSDRDARRLSRDLERFLEDAEGADVAVVYYAGHGIEAGGENYLVPVDADLSALEAAGERLVPLTGFIERLQAVVTVAIVMLDACRDNPFPAGSLVRVDAASGPAVIGVAGLAETRGASDLTVEPSSTDNFGTVIAFAAAPGRVALDGEPGGNSPYGAAVLRHLDAMVGEEFGTVMRMIAEEVYLKTGGRQRPWVNESLRRLLYFGVAPDGEAGDERDMLTERRQLLLTIAALPDLERRQVERAAVDGGVPMDAVYGMLKALGHDAPDDPAQLEKLLRDEAARFASVLAEREAILSPDPEIGRLSTLADDAEREGLLATANQFRERAKARFRELEGTLEAQQAALDQRFVEGALVFARSAQTRALAFDHLGAAQDYAEAFRLVDGRDARLAAVYRQKQFISTHLHASNHGDPTSLAEAIDIANDVVRRWEQLDDKVQWAENHANIGVLLVQLGELRGDDEQLDLAMSHYQTALGYLQRSRFPTQWANIQSNIGNLLQALGSNRNDPVLLRRSVAAYEAALEIRTRNAMPDAWATTQNNRANTLKLLAERTGDLDILDQVVAAHRSTLDIWTRQSAPNDWAMAQTNLGNALLLLGTQRNDKAAIEEAVASHRAALAERSRETMPRKWGETQSNLAMALHEQGKRENGTALLKEAEAAFRAALDVIVRDASPSGWAVVQGNLGVTLAEIGSRTRDAAYFAQAIAAFEDALKVRTRDRAPVDWASTHYNMAGSLHDLGLLEGDPALLERAIRAYRNVLEVATSDGMQRYWSMTQSALGSVLVDLGSLTGDAAPMAEAVTAYRAALNEGLRRRSPMFWAGIQYSLGNALIVLGQRENDTTRLKEAATAFQSALEEFSRERAPLQWATAQTNLGYAVHAIGRAEADTALLKQAIASYRAALEERTRERAPSDWATTLSYLGNALVDLSRHEQEEHLLAQAVDAYRSSLRERTRERSPGDWATTQNALAYALTRVGEIKGDMARFDEATTLLRGALEVQGELGLASLHHTQDSLCRVLLNVGRKNRDRETLLEAKSLCEAARAGLTQAGDPAAQEAADNLLKVEAELNSQL